MDAIYKNPDNDSRPWASDNPYAPGAATHQGMVYAIQHPFDGRLLYPSNGRCWTFGQEQMLEYMNAWANYELRDLHRKGHRLFWNEVLGHDFTSQKAAKVAFVEKPI